MNIILKLTYFHLKQYARCTLMPATHCVEGMTTNSCQKDENEAPFPWSKMVLVEQGFIMSIAHISQSQKLSHLSFNGLKEEENYLQTC